MKNVVFITGCGYGRCGTTWMQGYLNRLPGVFISGEIGILNGVDINNLLDRMIIFCRRGKDHNRAVENQHHHIVRSEGYLLDQTKCYIENIWFGPDHKCLKIAGVKASGLTPCSCVFNRLWPSAKYVACIRRPRSCFESLINTFRPKLIWGNFIKNWTRAVRDSLNHDNTYIFKIDDHTEETLRGLCSFLNIEQSPKADALYGFPLYSRSRVNGSQITVDREKLKYSNEVTELMGKLEYAEIST